MKDLLSLCLFQTVLLLVLQNISICHADDASELYDLERSYNEELSRNSRAYGGPVQARSEAHAHADAQTYGNGHVTYSYGGVHNIVRSNNTSSDNLRKPFMMYGIVRGNDDSVNAASGENVDIASTATSSINEDTSNVIALSDGIISTSTGASASTSSCACDGGIVASDDVSFLCFSSNDGGKSFGIKYKGTTKFSFEDIFKAYKFYYDNMQANNFYFENNINGENNFNQEFNGNNKFNVDVSKLKVNTFHEGGFYFNTNSQFNASSYENLNVNTFDSNKNESNNNINNNLNNKNQLDIDVNKSIDFNKYLNTSNQFNFEVNKNIELNKYFENQNQFNFDVYKNFDISKYLNKHNQNNFDKNSGINKNLNNINQFNFDVNKNDKQNVDINNYLNKNINGNFNFNFDAFKNIGFNKNSHVNGNHDLNHNHYSFDSESQAEIEAKAFMQAKAIAKTKAILEAQAQAQADAQVIIQNQINAYAQAEADAWIRAQAQAQAQTQAQIQSQTLGQVENNAVILGSLGGEKSITGDGGFAFGGFGDKFGIGTEINAGFKPRGHVPAAAAAAASTMNFLDDDLGPNVLAGGHMVNGDEFIYADPMYEDSLDDSYKDSSPGVYPGVIAYPSIMESLAPTPRYYNYGNYKKSPYGASGVYQRYT